MIGDVHPEDLRDLAPRRSGNLPSQGANARSDEEARVQGNVPVLEGILVRLEPLAVRHAADLAAAAEEDRGSYGFTLVPRGSEIGGGPRGVGSAPAPGSTPAPPGPRGACPRARRDPAVGPHLLARPGGSL